MKWVLEELLKMFKILFLGWKVEYERRVIVRVHTIQTPFATTPEIVEWKLNEKLQ